MRRSFFSYFVFFLLLGCTANKKVTNINFSPLKATFSSYHSAMGTGRGIIFRVDLTDIIINNCTIDSFYLNGKPMEFTIIQSEKTNYLEANYYVSIPSPSLNVGATEKKTTELAQITDSVIVARSFYPSWLIISNKSVKQKIDIPLYREIKSEAKY